MRRCCHDYVEQLNQQRQRTSGAYDLTSDGRTATTANLIVKDERQKKLGDIVTQYDALRRPTLLKTSLLSLTDGTGATTSDNFLLHRNWFSAKLSSSEPKTAAFVRELLSNYPAV